MDKEGYITIKLPPEIIVEIDYFIKNKKWGFRSRGEFVKEAVRRQLLEYKQKTEGGSHCVSEVA